jgi:hypothetical protein
MMSSGVVGMTTLDGEFPFADLACLKRNKIDITHDYGCKRAAEYGIGSFCKSELNGICGNPSMSHT